MTDSPQNWTDLAVPVSVRQQAVRTQLQQQEADYRSHLSGQTDGPYIGAVENFESWSHERLFAAAQSMSPGAINTMAAQWGNLQTAMLSDLLGFHGSVTGLIAEQWEGDAADAASAAVGAFAQSGTEFTTSLHASVGRLEQVSSAAQEVRIGVRPPVAPGLSLVPVAPKATEAAAEVERQAAVRVMQAIYTPTYVQAGTNVPTLPPPRDVVNGGLANGAGSPGMTGGAGGNTGLDLNNVQPRGSANSPSTQGVTGSDTSSSQAGSGGAAGTSGASPLDGSSLGTPGQSANGSPGTSDGSWSPTTAAAASAAPVGATSGANTGLGGGLGNTGPGGNAIGSGGGLGGPGGGFGGSGAGFGNASGLGAGGSLGSLGGLIGPGSGSGDLAMRSGAGPTAGAGTTAGAVAPGRSPVRGSMSGLARGAQHDGEEDDEYRPASYLVNIDNGNELIGELPWVVPPVIGAVED